MEIEKLVHIEKIEVHVHMHEDNGELLFLVQQLLEMEEEMSKAFDRIRESVAQTTGRQESVAALIRSFGEYIKRHANDPAALNTLADELDRSNQALVSAVNENPLPSEETGGEGTGGGGAGGDEPEPVTTEGGGTVNRDTGLRR